MADEFIAKENGEIKISEEVIMCISSISAKEVEGVAMIGTPASPLSELWGKKNQSKGVKAELSDGGAEVDIHISVRLGYKLSEVARKVQESVRFALESYVGLDNVMVNVFVDAIDAQQADTDKLSKFAFEEHEDMGEEEEASSEQSED